MISYKTKTKHKQNKKKLATKTCFLLSVSAWVTAAAWPVFNYKYWGNIREGKRVGRDGEETLLCGTGMQCGVWSITGPFSKPTGESLLVKKGDKNTENYIISRQQVTPLLSATLFQLRASQTSFKPVPVLSKSSKATIITQGYRCCT